MPLTQCIIGRFRRPMFAEGLLSLLEDEPGLSVRLARDEADAITSLNSLDPTIVILEKRDDEEQCAFLPASDSVAVILIDQEGKDVQIALRQIDRSQLRAAIRLVSETPHPKVIALENEKVAQPPFALPMFREGGASGLASVIAWLDAAFACALEEFARARGGAAGTPWMQDLHYLREAFSRGVAITPEEVARRFEALVNAPMWQVCLFRTFALNPVELKLLCLAAAPDLDQRFAQAIGLLQMNYAEARPTGTTLAGLLGPEHVGADIEALLAGRRVFSRLQMIRAETQAAPQPGYRVAPELFDLMIGVRRHAGPDWRLQVETLPPQDVVTEALAPVLAAPNPPLVLVSSETAQASDEVAAGIVACGLSVMRVNCGAAPAEGLAQRVTDWALTARLHDAVLMFERVDALPEAAQAALLSADIAGLVRAWVVVGSSAPVPVQRDALQLRVGKAGPAVHARRWRAACADHGMNLPRSQAQRLGGTLRLGLADLDAVIRMAAGQRRIGSDEGDMDLILSAARRVAASYAPETVRRPPCIFDWDDIVLPSKIKALVTSVPEHVRHGPLVLDEWDFASRLPYGRGVGVLFSGSSGTGKTMCAQVIASALGVELMQVEIARCVSKYIGETEKNIDRCFTAAEAASAVLLFDEADALFGKRTEIKDAHDRHANVEVAYLLQRIEAYEGLVILTTNLKANIDPAFLRRLRFVVEFPMPDAADRERIWTLAIPRAARCAPDVDTAFLARRLPLSGGSIQSIAVNAAFRAAAEDCEAIHMRHVMFATRAELIKNGLLSVERTLVDPEPLVLVGAVR